jgi:1,2-diacylglycerol 3-beta-galactosyltransferase
MTPMDFLFFDAGGGHRSAASALKLVIEEQRRPWEVRLVNLQELLAPLDPFGRLCGVQIQDLYNLMLRKGWTLCSAQLKVLLQALIRAAHRPQVRLLQRHWQASRPELVVSLIPHFNRAIAQSVRQALPDVPFVTILSDLADYPPHFWIERESQYLICGTERGVQQARELGHTQDRVFRTSGMILQPRFYRAVEKDRAEERTRRGLDPHRSTGLLLFGGYGSQAMLGIARRIDRAGLPVQLILICGRNERLKKTLEAGVWKVPRYVEGFTREVPYYMHLADFMIGKPGPGSISEAIAMGLPVIVERNAWTLPQERYNADWVLENGAGLVLHTFRDIVPAVEQMLAPEALARFQANARRIRNCAVFEIPAILGEILERHHAAA